MCESSAPWTRTEPPTHTRAHGPASPATESSSLRAQFCCSCWSTTPCSSREAQLYSAAHQGWRRMRRRRTHCTHMLEAVHGQKFVKDCSTTLLLRHTFTLLFCFSPTSALYILHCFSIRLLYLASPVPTLLQCYNMCILPLCMGDGRLQEFGGRLSKLGLLSH